MTKIIHHVVYARKLDQAELDRYGLDGWKLATEIEQATTTKYTFRKEVAADGD